jgi:uncharacterized damage-inducible protein DinB
MSATVNDVIVFGLKASHARLHMYIDDLKPAEFAHQPFPGVNSIAWILGHLALTDRRILGLLGAELPPLADGFDTPFKTTKQPAIQQTDLGNPADLIATLDAHRTKLIAAVEGATPDVLNKPLPNPVGAAKTVGEAAAFMAVHLAMHAGQITLIRRSLGYPPVV